MSRREAVVVYVLLGLLSLACGYVAKTQYGAQLDACIDQAKTRAEADKCMADVRLAWDEAGAKAPALVLDGGIE